MQIADKIMFATAILWALFAIYAFMLLLPFVDRRLLDWSQRIKHSKVPLTPPNRAQRFVFFLLSCLMLAVSLAHALHRDLRDWLGISPGMAVALMMLAPMIHFLLGRWHKPQTNSGSAKSPKP